MSSLSFILNDQIPSGKNQIRIAASRGKIYKYPDKRFVEWRQKAAADILKQRRTWTTNDKMKLPLRGPLKMIVGYRELKKVPGGGTRDITGMCDAIQHLMEYCELIENDGQIKELSWVPSVVGTFCVCVVLEAL